jgi:hypothetical protein
MNTFLKGFLTAGIIFVFLILLTGSSPVKDNNPYKINKPGRYQYKRGVDWRKNDFSTWVDTQRGIALVTYIDGRNVEQVEVSTFADVLEISKKILKNNP